jgi:hypothetical protein
MNGLTQARHVGGIEEMARSLIAITTAVPPDSFTMKTAVADE